MKFVDMISKAIDFLMRTLPSTFFIVWMMGCETYVALGAFRRQDWPMVFVEVMVVFMFFAWGVLLRLDRIKDAVKAD